MTNDLQKAFSQLGVSIDDLTKAKERQIGEVVTRKDKSKWRKEASGWSRITQGKSAKKDDEPVDDAKAPDTKSGKNVSDALAGHAKNATDAQLQSAIKNSKDSNIVEAAEAELASRKTGEKDGNGGGTPEGKTGAGKNSAKEKKPKKEREPQWYDGLHAKHQLSPLPVGIPEKDVIIYEGKDIDSHWAMKWTDPKTKVTKTAYTANFYKKNAEIKWARTEKLGGGKFLDDIDSKAKKMMASDDDVTQQKGAILSIIAKTGLRVGSKSAHAKTGNEGVSTLSAKSITIDGDVVVLSFIGKSYKQNTNAIEDVELAKYLSNRMEGMKDDDMVFSVDRYSIMNSFRDDMGYKNAKIKDIRTVMAGELASQYLKDNWNPPTLPKNKKEGERLVKKVLRGTYEYVSNNLNNTPAMAQKSYINPAITDKWLEKIGADFLTKADDDEEESSGWALNDLMGISGEPDDSALAGTGDQMIEDEDEDDEGYPLPDFMAGDEEENAMANELSNLISQYVTEHGSAPDADQIAEWMGGDDEGDDAEEKSELFDLIKGSSKAYSYGCVMLSLTIPKWKSLLKRIDTKDLASDGLEYEPHVTALFGLHLDEVSINDIKGKIAKYKSVSVSVGELSMFSNDEYDVLKLSVSSKELSSLNKELKKLPHTNSYPKYEPHVTIAYLKKGMADKYIKSLDVSKFIPDTIESGDFEYSYSDNGKKRKAIFVRDDSFEKGDLIDFDTYFDGVKKGDYIEVETDDMFKGKDISKLQRKVIVDKNGKRKTVYVSTHVSTGGIGIHPTQRHEEAVRTYRDKKKYMSKKNAHDFVVRHFSEEHADYASDHVEKKKAGSTAKEKSASKSNKKKEPTPDVDWPKLDVSVKAVTGKEGFSVEQIFDKHFVKEDVDEVVPILKAAKDKLGSYTDKTMMLADLIPTQPFLRKETIEKKLSGESEPTDVVVYYDRGDWYVIDGHHTVASMILKGDVSVNVKVFKPNSNKMELNNFKSLMKDNLGMVIPDIKKGETLGDYKTRVIADFPSPIGTDAILAVLASANPAEARMSSCEGDCNGKTIQALADSFIKLVSRDKVYGVQFDVFADKRMGRSGCSSYNDITLHGRGSGLYSAFPHEFGHAVEQASGTVRTLNSRFRTEGSTLIRKPQAKGAKSMYKGQYSDPDPLAVNNKFINTYVGRVYRHGGTEVLSMFFEKLYSLQDVRKLFKEKPEHVAHCINSLQSADYSIDNVKYKEIIGGN